MADGFGIPPFDGSKASSPQTLKTDIKEEQGRTQKLTGELLRDAEAANTYVAVPNDPRNRPALSSNVLLATEAAQLLASIAGKAAHSAKPATSFKAHRILAALRQLNNALDAAHKNKNDFPKKIDAGKLLKQATDLFDPKKNPDLAALL